MADRLKLILAVLIIGAAMGSFYYFGDESMLLRVAGLLVALGVSTAIAVRTEMGAEAFAFGRGAFIEMRKVVWPTGKETTQTTMIVLVAVVIMGLLLWLIDSFLGWAVRFLTGQGG